MAILIDGPSRGWIADSGHAFVTRWQFFHYLKLIGDWQVVVVASIALLFLHPLRWRAAGAVVTASVVSQTIGSVLKWIVGRSRPVVLDHTPFEVHPFKAGIHGLFHQTNLGFPSGHATSAWSLAAVLFLLVPRGRPVWLLAAIACSSERILSTAHWPSDVAGAAVLGVFCSQLAVWYAVASQPTLSVVDSSASS